MKIVKFFKNNINKYSFQTIIWAFWVQIAFLSVFIHNLNHFTEYSDFIIFLALSLPVFVIPIANLILILVYILFKEKEKYSSGFVIKNKILINNPIYKLLCILSFGFIVIFLISTTILSIYFVIWNIQDGFLTFVIFTLPILIIIFLLYLLARKFFIYK